MIRYFGRRAQVFSSNGILIYATGPGEKQQIKEHLLRLRIALNDAVVNGKLVIEGEPTRKDAQRG